MNLFQNHENPAFRYEGLVRSVFECSKYGDPWKYAAQDHYVEFENEPPSLYAKRALSTVIIKMIIDHGTKEAEVQKLLKLEDEVWNMSNSVKACEIIDKLTQISNDLGYHN